MRKLISGIYKIVSKIDGKYYVGSSYDIFGTRKSRHLTRLRKNDHHSIKLQNAFNKHGEDNFNIILIEEVDVMQLFIVEQKYLDIAKQEKEQSYNISFIAGQPDVPSGEESPNFKHISEDLKLEIKNYWIKFGSAKTRIFLKTLNLGGRVFLRLLKEFHLDEQALGQRKTNMSLWLKDWSKTEKNLQKGKTHDKYIHTHYHFYNRVTQEHFIGPIKELKNKYNLSESIYAVKNEKAPSCQDWILIKD